MKEILYIMSSDVELIKYNNTIKCIRSEPRASEKHKPQIIPISRLNSIEVYGNIKISTPLLNICNKLKIPCYFNTFYGNPIGQFIPESSRSSIIRLKQYETYLNKYKKLQIAKAIIKKAANERIRIINKYNKQNKINSRLKRIKHYKKRLNNAKNVSELRGIEGNLMKSFFKFFSELLYHLPFNGRTRMPPKDETNALLSFGNVVLYNAVRSIIYRCALDPLVGFLHEPHENRNSLALDIAEIYRPIVVDNLILQLDHKKHILPSHFDKDKVKCYLNKKGKEIWISNLRAFLDSSIDYPPLKRKISIREEIKIECYNLIKFFTGEKSEYIPIQFKNK